MPAQAPEKTVPEVQSEARTKGERTRERILDLTYEAVIRKGFASTSIEELVEAAGITKSGFFYHFKDKTDLARQLIETYTGRNIEFLDVLAQRARELSDDPLHSFLIFLKLYAEEMEDKPVEHPGCMVATVTFQDHAWDQGVRQLLIDQVVNWRSRFVVWLEEIAAIYPPKGNARTEDLAEAILAFTYGGMTIARALSDPSTISRQTMMFRETVRLHFLGA